VNRTSKEDVVVFAPIGRDASVAASILIEGGLEARVAHDVTTFVTILRTGAGFAIVTEEALRGADLRGIAGFIEAQAEWSDFPFILLTQRGGGLERNPAAGRFLETLGNVTFLERPFHPTTLLSLSRAALRARRRQYEARSRLEAIYEGEQRLSVAMAAGGLGAWTVHLPTMALEASPQCKAHFGRQPGQDFTREDLVASIHPDDRDWVLKAISDAMASATDYEVEFRCIWPDQSLHWLQVRGRPTYDRDNSLIFRSGVSHDVTEQKRVEQELRDFAAELEIRVEERTREREAVVAQLHEAQKLETLGQLTGGVAHDFNNLLTPVIGGLDMLRRMHEDERSQRLIGGALQASERARTLVSRLLAFARRQNLEARPIDAVTLVEGMLDLIKRSLGPQIDVRLDASGGLPAAMVDPNQLELALLNLAVNARDAMPDGGRLTIAVEQQTVPKSGDLDVEPGSYIRLSIADDGTGMDEATLKRAIEPFYSTKGVGKGTGLGLSMVHGLAAQSGGALRLSSVLGRGTTAELWLPVADRPARITVPMAEDTAGPGRPLKILLTDDEELVRIGTADMLRDLGHNVTHVGSGARAITLLRTEDFDLLVTDYLMPGMNGIELAREARQVRADLPVLLITGFADLADSAFADIVRLPKPFRRSNLARAIRDLTPAPASVESE
jgi:signal transduction histidine kinase/FixJ family two-component response regulator